MELRISWNLLPSHRPCTHPCLLPPHSPWEAVSLELRFWESLFLPHWIVASKEGVWETWRVFGISFAWSWWFTDGPRWLMLGAPNAVWSPWGQGVKKVRGLEIQQAREHASHWKATTASQVQPSMSYRLIFIPSGFPPGMGNLILM